MASLEEVVELIKLRSQIRKGNQVNNTKAIRNLRKKMAKEKTLME